MRSLPIETSADRGDVPAFVRMGKQSKDETHFWPAGVDPKLRWHQIREQGGGDEHFTNVENATTRVPNHSCQQPHRLDGNVVISNFLSWLFKRSNGRAVGLVEHDASGSSPQNHVPRGKSPESLNNGPLPTKIGNSTATLRRKATSSRRERIIPSAANNRLLTREMRRLLLFFFRVIVGVEAFHSLPQLPLSTIRHRPQRSLLFLSKAIDISSSSFVDIGAASLPGRDPNRPQKVNQDAFFFDSKDGMAGVMDGHGRKAELLTQFLAIRLPECIREQQRRKIENDTSSHAGITELEELVDRLANFRWQDDYHYPPELLPGYGDPTKNNNKKMFAVLRNSFHQAHWDAMQNSNVPAGRSGTTCVVCMWDDDYIHVAHVGDSRAYRFRSSRNHNEVVGEVKFIQMQPLSTPTTVLHMPAERKRIENTLSLCEQRDNDRNGNAVVGSGGRIDGNGNVWYGPIGISMTRALGDSFLLKAGVVPTPLFHSFERKQLGANYDYGHYDDDWIILGTDGVWDALPLDQIQALIATTTPTTTSQEVAQQLAVLAKKAWIDFKNGPMKESEDDCAWDDITCVVLKLA